MTENVLKASGVCRDFGPVRVLSDVSLDFRKGEVHALIGENGAGKSTLVKILAGYLAPTEGEVRMNGKPVRWSDSRMAEDHGVVLIHQEFNLAPHLSVEGNIFLGRELRWGPFLNKPAMRGEARRVLHELGMDIDPRTSLHDLPISQVQMVEIAKSLERNTRGVGGVLIMDEPTGVLTPTEAEVLFQLINRLKQKGLCVVYISHKLEEVKRIADRVTVLRDGRLITTQMADQLTEEKMANLMVGRELEDMFPPKCPPDYESAETAMRVKNLKVPGWVEELSFDIKKGEILGLAGLIGAGRTEAMEGIMGLRKHAGGSVELFGKTLPPARRPWHMVDRGVVYLSEDRKGKGIIPSMPMRPNLTLMALRRYCKPFIDKKAENKSLKGAVERYEIRCGRPQAPVSTLSGGNQQKLALAKIMDAKPSLIILDEPTRGIDVGTKQQIYSFTAKMAQEGIPCIFISSELPEIIGLCHRVIVMCRGRATGTVTGSEINEHDIMHYAADVKRREVS